MSNKTALESISVSSIMTPDVKTAKETQDIQEVCRVMSENKIGSTVILNGINSGDIKDNKPIGIVTERDVVRAISGHAKLFSIHTQEHEIMSSPLITINPNNSIRDAMETMQQQKDIRRLPVVDNKATILGIITNKDIFRAILKNQAVMSNFVNGQILVDHQSIYGKFIDYWLRSNIHRLS